jgi:hypothetical protein
MERSVLVSSGRCGVAKVNLSPTPAMSPSNPPVGMETQEAITAVRRVQMVLRPRHPPRLFRHRALVMQSTCAHPQAANEEALSRHSPEQQESLLMRTELGCTPEEIAQATGRPSAGAARVYVAAGDGPPGGGDGERWVSTVIQISPPAAWRSSSPRP